MAKETRAQKAEREATNRELAVRFEEMIDEHKERDDLNIELQKIRNYEWDLPSELKELGWMIRAVSAEARQQEMDAENIYSTLKPSLTIMPTTINQEVADSLERALLYQFNMAGGTRGFAHLLRKIVASFIQNDECAIQPVFLKSHFKASGQSEKDPRVKYALERGDFAINVFSPSDIYARYSQIGVEEVLLVGIFRYHEVLAMWPQAEEELNRIHSELGEAEREWDWVTLYDHTDFTHRSLGITFQAAANTRPVHGNAKIFYREEHKQGFLNWVVQTGGGSIDTNPAFQRNPLLGPIAHTKQWELQNLFDSLQASDALTQSGSPQDVIIGTDDQVDFDDSQPHKPVLVDPEASYQRLPSPQLNQAVGEIVDRMRNRIRNGGLGDEAFGAFDSGSSTATATLSANLQLRRVAPYKLAAERAIEEVFRHMVKHYKLNKTNVPKVYLKDDLNNTAETEEIPWEMLPEFMDIRVELRADDSQSDLIRANFAQTLINTGVAPLAAYEKSGLFTNAKEVIDLSTQAKFDAVAEDGELQLMQAENQLNSQVKLQGLEQVVGLTQTPEGQMVLQVLQQLAGNPQALQQFMQQLQQPQQQPQDQINPAAGGLSAVESDPTQERSIVAGQNDDGSGQIV